MRCLCDAYAILSNKHRKRIIVGRLFFVLIPSFCSCNTLFRPPVFVVGDFTSSSVCITLSHFACAQKIPPLEKH